MSNWRNYTNSYKVNSTHIIPEKISNEKQLIEKLAEKHKQDIEDFRIIANSSVSKYNLKIDVENMGN